MLSLSLDTMNFGKSFAILLSPIKVQGQKYLVMINVQVILTLLTLLAPNFDVF